MVVSAERSACCKQPRICLHPIPSGPWTVSPISPSTRSTARRCSSARSTGNIFSTSNDGETWFDIGQPSVFGSPGNASIALAYGAPDPAHPEGVGNLGNFIYVGTSTGQIYISQDGGGSGSSNNWINVSTGLDGSKVESIVTDPIRGSHEAYAVTQKGVYVIADSVPSATNPTPTWVNITSNIFKLAVHDLRSELQPNDRPERDHVQSRDQP